MTLWVYIRRDIYGIAKSQIMCYIRKTFFGLDNIVFNNGNQGLMRRPSIKSKATIDYNCLTLIVLL